MKLHYFNLIIDKEIWTNFADTVPRSETINHRIVKLIEDSVEGIK